jgi:PAS domain S-box-containing protein
MLIGDEMRKEGFDAFTADGVKSFNILLPELMSNLLHNLPGIAYRCRNDSKWTMLFISEGCYQLTGYHPGDLLYNSDRSFEDIIHEDDRSLVRNNVNNGVSQRTQFQMTYRIVDKKGNIRWVWEQGNAVYDAHNNPIFLDGFISDITEKKASEDKLSQTAKQLVELNVTKDKFFSIIAHDLQNPLYAIISLSDFIRQNNGEFGYEELLDFIHQINLSAKSAHKLLENLLDWARSQTGKITIQNERFNMHSLIQGCMEINDIHAIDKGITIINDVNKDLQMISDVQLLSAVFRNLISNAIKFSSPSMKVLVKSEIIDNKVAISVSDTGIGISRTNLSKLFKLDNDFRNLGTANETGTGLGLILCHDFISRIGGEITVASKLNRGSTFSVLLNQHD